MNKLNIPFFDNDDEIIKKVAQIRSKYLNDYDIIKSELSKQDLEYIENGSTKTGSYISGVDIFLEKRKEDIKVPLIENLKIIYGKNQQELISEIQEENVNKIFPNIDYQYWSNRNPFYSDTPLLQTMRICITHYASLPGLINDVIQNIENITCKSLVKLIELEIKTVVENNLFNDKNKMLRIFDLINGWGGKMGKATYVKPKGNTTRNSSENWFNHYVNGVKNAIKGNNEGLVDFTNIDNVGTSFGTKHLYFWSLFGGGSPIPIYDNRIKTLLYLGVNYAPPFEHYLKHMTNFSKYKKITIYELEKALFAFSTNYFPNEELNIKEDFIDATDFDEASRLEELYNLKNK